MLRRCTGDDAYCLSLFGWPSAKLGVPLGTPLQHWCNISHCWANLNISCICEHCWSNTLTLIYADNWGVSELMDSAALSFWRNYSPIEKWKKLVWAQTENNATIYRVANMNLIKLAYLAVNLVYYRLDVLMWKSTEKSFFCLLPKLVENSVHSEESCFNMKQQSDFHCLLSFLMLDIVEFIAFCKHLHSLL